MLTQKRTSRRGANIANVLCMPCDAPAFLLERIQNCECYRLQTAGLAAALVMHVEAATEHSEEHFSLLTCLECEIISTSPTTLTKKRFYCDIVFESPRFRFFVV